MYTDADELPSPPPALPPSRGYNSPLAPLIELTPALPLYEDTDEHDIPAVPQMGFSKPGQFEPQSYAEDVHVQADYDTVMDPLVNAPQDLENYGEGVSSGYDQGQTQYPEGVASYGDGSGNGYDQEQAWRPDAPQILYEDSDQFVAPRVSISASASEDMYGNQMIVDMHIPHAEGVSESPHRNSGYLDVGDDPEPYNGQQEATGEVDRTAWID